LRASRKSENAAQATEKTEKRAAEKQGKAKTNKKG
jgi:hypothetical protein